MADRKLTIKQQRFVDAIAVHGNATKAAEDAGYSPKTAAAIGCENLRKPKIAAAIRKAAEERSKRIQITADQVQLQLARISLADIRDLFTWNAECVAFVPSIDLTDDQAAAIQSVEAETLHYTDKDGGRTTKIKLKLRTEPKVRALELLAKRFGMLTDRRAEEFGGEPIQIVEIAHSEPSTNGKPHAAEIRISGG